MSRKITYKFVKSQFEKEGYELLSNKYIIANTKLDYICPQGHRHSIIWNNWQQGQRCAYCVGNFKLDINFIRSEFKKESYELLTKKYINAHQKLEYICSNGHKYEISWLSWQQGHRCFYCARNVKKTIEFINSEFKKDGYLLLTTEYKNCSQKLEGICPKGHRYSVSWDNWKQNKRCPYCAVISSKGEVEVRDFVESLGIKVSPNDRNQIFNPETGCGFELDIFMPTLNKAIEYNGEYWHQDESRDLFKQQLCKSKSIELLTIWDKEWLNSDEKCRNKIVKFVFS